MKKMNLLPALALVSMFTAAGLAQANSHEGKRAHRSQAKADCLQQNPQLKGKELRSCMRDKQKPAAATSAPSPTTTQ